jgi:hypothetical protein
MHSTDRGRTDNRLVPGGIPVSLRFVSLVLCTLAVGAASASAGERSVAGISPGLVHRGQRTTIVVSTTKPLVSCAARLRYSDGHVQTTPRRKANHIRRVSFTIRIPLTAATGAGSWRVTCGTAVRTGSFIVAAVKSTLGVDQPKVVVDRQGFTQRPARFGTGSTLSYGLILHDTSATEDAQNVYVIVNMVAADGELIGSKSQTVALVPAGGTYALGDSMNLRTQVAATRLEITVRVGAHTPKQAYTMPEFANVRILPSDSDPGWVSEVDAEIVNVNTTKTLASANVSLVVVDAAGNPLGGGRSFSFASLPAGTRFVFTAQSGFSSIPLDRAAAVLISSEPRYTNPS